MAIQPGPKMRSLAPGLRRTALTANSKQTPEMANWNAIAYPEGICHIAPGETNRNPRGQMEDDYRIHGVLQRARNVVVNGPSLE